VAVHLAYTQWNKLLELDRDVGHLGYALIYWLQYFGARARVSEGLRTRERQAYLYASGRTRPGPIVTKTLASRHLGGRAFDIDFIGRHPDDVPIPWWEFAGYVGEQLGLRWGGRWALRDYRHFEV